MKESDGKSFVMMMLSIGTSDLELTWFDFETRMRKLVYELLQPTVQRSHEDREILYTCRKSI